jgi:FAD/FMN-containing dehydrogenase
VRPLHRYRLRNGITRRGFLGSLLAAGASAACTEPASVAGGIPKSGATTPFPESVDLYREDFENWSGEIAIEGLQTFAPRSPEDVVAVANWAAQNGYVLRARGMRHNWSPLAVAATTTADTPLLLADTTQHLHRVELVAGPRGPAVRAEAGVLMEDLLGFLEQGGYGFTNVPCVGEITLGGALAIDGHGCSVPAAGETPVANQTFGSLSNRVLSLTAVAWDPDEQRYGLRTFDRTDLAIGPLLTHLGRAFITEVTLAVEPNANLRCVSYVDIPAAEMFAAPGSGGRDIASFLESAGRIESIWFPFTDAPWLKVWSVSPDKPPTSREVTAPYNYPFSDNIPDPIVDLANALVTGHPERAPEFGQTMLAVSRAGLLATQGLDLWGPSKNTQLFIKPTTLRITELSYAALTARADVQRVLSDFVAEFLRRRDAWAAQGRYPINMPVEFRVTGVDRASDIGLPGAREPVLSALAPRPDRPEWDSVVWLSILTLPGTPGLHEFLREMEQWMHGHYDGTFAALRPEWSKGWAYTNDAAWADPAVLEKIREAHRAGRRGNADWDAAARQLSALDPAGIYRNAFLDELWDH